MHNTRWASPRSWLGENRGVILAVGPSRIVGPAAPEFGLPARPLGDRFGLPELAWEIEMLSRILTVLSWMMVLARHLSTAGPELGCHPWRAGREVVEDAAFPARSAEGEHPGR